MTSPPDCGYYRDEDEGSIILSLISQLRCAPRPRRPILPTPRPDNPLPIIVAHPPSRVGMDLSKVTFPTFVLEPRSMLERITDFMAHPDLIFGWVVPSPSGSCLWLRRGTRIALPY